MGGGDALGIDGTVVVVVADLEDNVALACRNLPYADLTTADVLNTYDTLKPDRLLFTKAAFESIEGRLAKS